MTFKHIKVPDDLMKEFQQLHDDGKFQITVIEEKKIPNSTDVELVLDINPEALNFLQKMCDRLGITINQFFHSALAHSVELLEKKVEK